MAVDEIVLVADGDGHWHVVVGWGHGLLRERGGERQGGGGAVGLDLQVIQNKRQNKTTL